MNPIKNILVCLDITRTDEDLMTFAKFMLKNSPEAEKVYFINVLKHFHLPSEIKKDFPDLEGNLIESRTKKVKEIIDKEFEMESEIDKEIIVVTGSGLKTVLKAVDEKKIDLVVLGRKTDGSGTGVLTQRMTRRCPVTMIIIPEGSSKKISKESNRRILVPIDFSDYSMLAIKRAVDIAKNYKDTEIFCQHVYSVPTGYHYTGKSHDDFAKIMEQNARKRFRKFIEGCDCNGVKLSEIYTLDDNENIVEDMHNYAKEINATGIIFGSKGMTATTSFFLGSTAEKLIKIDTEFPLMVVRKAGDYKGFMHLIKKI